MTGGERGQWPAHLSGLQKIATINRTRDNASRRVLRQIPLDNPFEQTPQLERAVYSGVERIARMPQEVNRVYHTIIALRDVSLWLSIEKSFEELKREVSGMQEVPRSVTDANDERQRKYEFQMRDAIDSALRGVMEKPDGFPNQATREVIQGYLQTREAT